MPAGVTRPTLAAAPTVLRTTGWDAYALLDSGNGRKLERYGETTVVRPEPQCLWRPALPPEAWAAADAVFDPSDEEDAGGWRVQGVLAGRPDAVWPLAWRAVRFEARLTPFRHLAFFPEQAANWDWLDARVRAMARGPEPPRVLNLFGYTGVASLVCAAAGAAVTHVDASKKSIAWARANAELSGLADRPIRWICEDVRRYVQREVRRGARYDGIILDPPKYGRGPAGEVWRLFEDVAELTRLCAGLLSATADFLLLNAYAARVSGLSLAHLLSEGMAERGDPTAAGPGAIDGGAIDGGAIDRGATDGDTIDWGELALAETPAANGGGGREIGLSFFARWRSGAP